MAGTEKRGRHARPDEPDPVDASVGGADREGPVSDDNSMTQALPTVVRREGLAGEDAAQVRGVAKRVPSALPALGGDELPDGPASARARRRAREAADAEPESPVPPAASIPRQRGPESPAGIGDVELTPIGRRVRDTDPGPAAGSLGQPAASADAPSPDSGAGRHAADRSGESAGGSHETPYAGGGEATAPPAPPPPPVPPAPPVMGQPPEEPRDRKPAAVASSAADEIIDAEIIDEPPRPYIPVDVETDEWATLMSASPEPPPLPAPSLAPGPQGAGPQGPPRQPSGPPSRPRGPVPQGPPSGPGPRHASPPGSRPGQRQAAPAAGPGVFESDPWETAPLPPVEEEYRGRRRHRARRGGPGRAGWLVVLGVVVALSAAVAVPFVLPLGDGSPQQAVTPGPFPTATSAAPVVSLPAGWPIMTAAPSLPPTAEPTDSATPSPTTATTTLPPPPGAPGNLSTSGATNNSIQLSWSASSGTVTQYLIERCQGASCFNFAQFATSTGTSYTAGGLSQGTTYRFRVRAENEGGRSGYSNIANGTTTAPFSLSLEAESPNRAIGCAMGSNFSGASGGRIVDRIGEANDWPGCGADGAVRFTNVNLPAGTYTITVYYVFAQQNQDASRRGRLRLDTTGSGDDHVFDRIYPRTTSIEGWTTESFTISTTRTYTITFGHLADDGQDRAPALDRIVIQQTS